MLNILENIKFPQFSWPSFTWLRVFNKKALHLSVFFLITPLTILASIAAIELLPKVAGPQTVAKPYLSSHEAGSFTTIQAPVYGAQVYASLPSSTGQIMGEAIIADARQEIIRQYMAKYNSPLEPHAQFLVDTAEKYELDFRLLVAIAQQESNLCKKIPESTYNCWGWGIHSRGTLGFESFEEAIETVSKGLKEEYVDKGYITPEQIMSKYTPASPGSWARGVNQFLADME